MDTPRDPWLQEQIEQYQQEYAASAAMYQQAARQLSARQLLASRRRRLRLLGRLLRAAFGHSHRGGGRASNQPPAVLEGMVTPTPGRTDQRGQTVIVIGVLQQTKGE